MALYAFLLASVAAFRNVKWYAQNFIDVGGFDVICDVTQLIIAQCSQVHGAYTVTRAMAPTTRCAHICRVRSRRRLHSEVAATLSLSDLPAH